MEIIDIFFKEVERILLDYAQRPPFINELSNNPNILELGKYLKQCNIPFERKKDIILNKELALTDKEVGIARKIEKNLTNEDLKDICTGFERLIDQGLVECVSWDISSKCISMLNEKLLSLGSVDNRTYLAKLYSKSLDSKIYTNILNIDDVENKGYNACYLEGNIIDFMHDSIKSFATFDIDLIPFLKEGSDVEKYLDMDYSDYRYSYFVIPTKKGNDAPTEYLYDEEKILKIFKFCSGDTFEVNFNDFIAAISSADLSKIYHSEGVRKNKFIYSISVIKKCIDDTTWYKKAANSIGEEPTSCSKKSVPKDWKESINAIK